MPSTGKTKEQAEKEQAEQEAAQQARSEADQKKAEQEAKKQEEELKKAQEQAEKSKQAAKDAEKNTQALVNAQVEQSRLSVVNAMVKQVPNSGFLSLNGQQIALPKQGATVKVPECFVLAFPAYLMSAR